jgi:hypothetical protein
VTIPTRLEAGGDDALARVVPPAPAGLPGVAVTVPAVAIAPCARVPCIAEVARDAPRAAIPLLPQVVRSARCAADLRVGLAVRAEGRRLAEVAVVRIGPPGVTRVLRFGGRPPAGAALAGPAWERTIKRVRGFVAVAAG